MSSSSEPCSCRGGRAGRGRGGAVGGAGAEGCRACTGGGRCPSMSGERRC
jgi:hypothetical protein